MKLILQRNIKGVKILEIVSKELRCTMSTLDNLPETHKMHSNNFDKAVVLRELVVYMNVVKNERSTNI